MLGIHAAFEGRVGSEPELRFSAQGKPVLNLSVAVGENRAHGDGAETTWIRVSAWEDLAEQLNETLKKGAEVYVEGKLTLRTWSDAKGNERAQLQCSAWTVQPLGQIGRKAPPRPAAGDVERSIEMLAPRARAAGDVRS